MPGQALPSFAPSSEPDPDPVPVTSPDDHAENRERTDVESDAAMGTPGIPTPAAAAELLVGEAKRT